MIYISTCCLRDNRDILRVLQVYEEAGIKNVELGSVHTYFPNLDILLDFNFNYLIHNYFPPSKESFNFNLASKNQDIKIKSINLAKRAIDLCKKIRSPLYSFHAGFRLDPLRLGEKFVGNIIPYDEAISIFEESLRIICNYAKAVNIKLAIEPNVVSAFNVIDETDSILLLTREEEISSFLSKLAYDNLGLLLDIGHTQVSANFLKFDKDIFFDGLLSRAFVIHIHDNNSVDDQHLALNKSSWGLYKVRYCKNIPIILESQNLSIQQIFKNIDLIENNM